MSSIRSKINSVSRYLLLLVPIYLLAPAFSLADTASTPTFRLFKPISGCSAAESLTCWIAAVFSWSQMAILMLATVVIIAAGLIYMTSAGNEKQIALAKKLIFGALSGVAVIVLGKFFLTIVVGVPWVT